MERQRFNLEDLLEELRINNFADVSQIDYAVLETNGEISIIPKTEARPVTISDLNLSAPPAALPHTVNLLTVNLTGGAKADRQGRNMAKKTVERKQDWPN